MNTKLIFATIILTLFVIGISGCQTGYVGEELEEGLTCVPPELIETPLTEEVTEPTETIAIEEPPKKLPTVAVKEGEKVSFPGLQKVDEDGDVITYTFTEPLDTNGEWLTKPGDEGSYTVTITASDGKVTTTQDILIIVEGLNKAPVISDFYDLTVKEGDTVLLEPEITDSNDDELTVTYSGWMDSSRYKTDYQDSGTHYVTLTAADGDKTTTRTIKVIVKNMNRIPIITSAEDLYAVVEGDLVTVSVFATDADGDTLTYEYEAPLDKNGQWQTAVGDAGTYTLDVEVSDGEDIVTEGITITVEKLNRPPVFNVLDKDVLVTVYPDSTATVEIEPIVSDPDGDDVTVEYSGWMRESKKTVGYEDGGVYEVTVTASDGREETSETVTVRVNRAPIIII